MSTVLLDLFLDNNSIDLWGQYSAFHFKGTVELTLDRPVNIREITVGIKGVLQTIVSTDFPDTMFKEDVGALESSHFKKHPFQKSSLVAIGYAESRQIVLKTKLVVLRHEIPVLYTPNIYRWPFILTLEDPHILPPSILLPRHNIHYQITAHVTLGSLGDHLKVGYWSIYQNARKHALIAYRRLSNPPPLPDQDDSLPDYPSPTYTLTPHQARHSLLSTRIPLQVNQYSTSINGVSPEARRYRGVRQGTIRYETCLPNNTWIGRTRYEFLCEFYPLRQDVTIDEIVCCVEQSETYPVRGGKVQSGQQLSAKDMTTHLHRYCETHYQVNVSDDLSSISLFVPLDSPLLSQDVSTTALQIEHRLRLVVHFGERAHERKMTLSFPLLIGAMDQAGYSQWTSNNDIHITQDLFFLPSYSSVLCEESPPACNFLS